MSQASFRIDSPSPALALQEAEKYFNFMLPSMLYGGMDVEFEEFKAELESGAYLLIRVWAGEDLISVSAVQVRELTEGRDLYIVATSSNRNINAWIDDFDRVLVKLAHEAECDTITVMTRSGMGRIAKRAGYKIHQVVIRKRVSEWAVH